MRHRLQVSHLSHTLSSVMDLITPLIEVAVTARLIVLLNIPLCNIRQLRSKIEVEFWEG